MQLRRLELERSFQQNIASFEGALPSLVALDIANNNFVTIPPAIFALRALRRLDLRGNNFTNIKLTAAQFNFLQALDEFDVDSFGDVICNTTQTLQTSSHTLDVCVLSPESTEDQSSNKALIAGVMATSFVLLFILGIVFVFRYLRHRAMSLKPGSEIVNLRQELISSTEETPPYKYHQRVERHSTNSTPRDPAPRHVFPYEHELEMLLLNVEELEYIRKFDNERRSRDPSREAFLTRFRGSRFLSRMYGLEALFEYMEGGNLRVYLDKAETTTEFKGWRSQSAWKLQVAFDVAEALAYAHAFKPTTSTIDISHRDERWLSPEVITGTADYSPAADIYAFGVILSEIDTHSAPLENTGSGRQNLSDVEILDLVASGKLHPVFTLGYPTGVRELAERCLSLETADRPTALQAVVVLRTLLSEIRTASYTI
ncbi:Protein kinase domain [Phytophthora infestans]|uniref:Protein kinase domain n=1 Tax=Phytophthora infestans TaxID=4787 RepID=A0A833SMW8_PHYIN|nr:Protein kinase domain [Phytophthora infestans]